MKLVCFSFFVFRYSIKGEVSLFFAFRFSIFEFGPNIEFWHSKSYFDIGIRTKYRILSFKILFRHSNSGRISNFDIQTPILTFEFGPNIEFWHSKSYFDIRIRAEYRILTFKILFWHSNSGRISNFDIQNSILTFEFGHSARFWMSKFDIRPDFECRNRILNVKFDIRPEFECRNRILNVKIRYSVRIRMSK